MILPMILPIVQYGHPVLRQKGARVESITPAIQQRIADMFETMYGAPGIGLAAQQVGEALQLCVIDVRGIEDRPSTLQVNGQDAPVETIMPLVLVNPEIKPEGEVLVGPEGCLSFPEMFGDIARPAFVDVTALNALGQPIAFRAGGLLGRAIQHEVDHLNGILFIDRMTSKSRGERRVELEELQAQTRERLAKVKR